MVEFRGFVFCFCRMRVSAEGDVNSWVGHAILELAAALGLKSKRERESDQEN